MEKAKIEISKPRGFGLAGVLATHGINLLLGIPVILAALALLSLKNLGIFNLLIPVLALGIVIYVFPFFGNAYVSRIVRRLRSSTDPSIQRWVVQITLCPRIQKGFRG